MRTVALLGGAEETRLGCLQSSADEFWTLNWSYLYDWVPRIDRLFEMHPIWIYGNTDNEEYQKPRDHWKWLTEGKKPYPIYMLADLPQVPSCVRYPIEAVTEYIFGDRLISGQDPSDFYSSSFDYMMALAIFEQFDVIELYGFEMGSITEYRYQREGAAFFIGQAVARGITVTRPRISVLLRGRRYGYHGGQMIFRQDLERILWKYQEEHKNALARMQHQEGMLHEMLNNADGPDKPERLEEAQAKLQELRDLALMSSACEQTMIYLIQNVDLEEVELKITNPLETIPLEG